MLAVRTASAGKIAPFGLLPSRTGQPSHRFFLCSVGAELSSPSSLSNQPNLPCNDPLANHHVRRHFPVSIAFLSNYSPQLIRIINTSRRPLSIAPGSRASTQIRVTQDAGQYLKRILGFHLIPSVSILHQSGRACSPPRHETQSKHPQPLART